MLPDLPARESRTDEAKRHCAAKKRGVLLGFIGLTFASVVLLVLRLAGEADVSFRLVMAFQALVVVSFGALWLLVHLGRDRRLAWDPHFLFTPSLVGILLLAALLVAAPEIRLLVFGGFFIVLLFWVGIANFVEVLLFTVSVTAAYSLSIAIVLYRGRSVISWGEVLGSILFLAGIGVYAAFVLERARRSRREARRLREELYRLAVVDPLTGLPNRRAFRQAAEAEEARLDRQGGECALAILDLDHFKSINDECGHLVGDEVLRRVAGVVRQGLRQSDLAARLGGEEFGLVLPATGPEAAFTLVDRLRREVAALDLDDVGIRRPITLSGGLAAHLPGESYLETWRRADQALYRAKEGGRDHVLVAPTVEPAPRDRDGDPAVDEATLTTR